MTGIITTASTSNLQGANSGVNLTNPNAASASATTSNSASALSTLTGNVDTFLKLLTSQLKNQDPLDPTETSDFTNQLVLFTQAEQSIAQNSNLERLIALSQSNQTAALVSYIGKTVEAKNSKVTIGTSGAKIDYELPEKTTNANLVITDANNKAVRVIALNTATGRQSVQWDGKDSAGQQLSAGTTYSLNIDARDVNNKQLTGANHYSGGVVNSVERVNDKEYLLIGTQRLEAKDVLKISS
ncbi:MAG: flagellar hook assembly protein FlgD [Pseudomonadota bacterium]